VADKITKDDVVIRTKMFKLADTNKDKAVDLVEFKAM